jgi:hypothetical protein
MSSRLDKILRRHLSYCRTRDWAGIDPYDALNSEVLSALPLVDARLPRIAFTQILKRSPIDIRPLLRIEGTQNPKALACFLSAFVKLSTLGIGIDQEYPELMIRRLIALRSKDMAYWCWGYSFPWQTRTILVPKWAPNLVCTCFVAGSLLDAYEQHQDERCFSMALSAGNYIVGELYWAEKDAAGFAYPLPSMRQRIPNANFLAAALLCRLYRHTRQEKFLRPALAAARYSAGRQLPDGSWHYGEAPTQRWIDNFHTGYNLSALWNIGRQVPTTEFEGRVRSGLDFYKSHFFRSDGAVRYFHNRDYPRDSHCVAQSILTLLDLESVSNNNVTLAHSVLSWAMNHLWDEQGYFYYRVHRFTTDRTSYMRWTQAWMFLALASVLHHTVVNCGTTETSNAPIDANE